MSKEFEVKRSNDPLFVLDCSIADHFEKMVEFTASAARSILESGGQAGLYLPGGETSYLPVNGGERHFMNILYVLAKARPQFKNVMEEMVEEPKLFQHNGSVIFIASSLTSSLLEQAEMLVRMKRNVIIFLAQAKAAAPQEKVLIQEALQRGMHIERLYDGEVKADLSGEKEV